jgi:hypothetical protein
MDSATRITSKGDASGWIKPPRTEDERLHSGTVKAIHLPVKIPTPRYRASNTFCPATIFYNKLIRGLDIKRSYRGRMR